jgi:carboxylesterase type B
LAFAKTGDPSNSRVGNWLPYGTNRHTMILGESIRSESEPFETERLAWEGVQKVGSL